MSVDWFGDKIKKRMRHASAVGVNRTMGDAVRHSKDNHPWTYRTGTLEGGIKIVTPASPSQALILGVWGPANVLYAKFLEFSKQWTWLRPAAKDIYPRLKGYIRAAYGG